MYPLDLMNFTTHQSRKLLNQTLLHTQSCHLLLVGVESQSYPLRLTRAATWTCSGFVPLPLWGKNRHQIICQAAATAVVGWQMVSPSVTNLCLHYRLLIKPCLAWRPWWSGLTPVCCSIFQVTLSHTCTNQGHFFFFLVGKCAIKSGIIVPEDLKTLTFNRSASLSLCTKIFRLWRLILASLDDQLWLWRLAFLQLVCPNAPIHTNMTGWNWVEQFRFLIKNNANKDGWQKQVEWKVQYHCLEATHEYFSHNNIMQFPVSRLRYTASPARLRLPLALESHTGVMAMAASVSAWTPFSTFDAKK